MKRITALLLAVTLFFSGAGEILAAEGSETNSNVNVGTDTEILLSEGSDYGLKMENREGTCGATGNEANVTWAIYDSNADGDDTANTGDTLVLSGSGVMVSYEDSWSVPWSSYREDITTVIFEENSNITNIGDNAFYNCKNLSSIEIPNSVTSIGKNTFNSCTSLTSITISESVQTIGDGAFQGCNQLEIHVADTSNYFCVEDGILYSKDKTALILGTAASGDFVIPDSVTKINASAFYNCTGLTGITIPDEVTYIGDYTFYKCKNLSNVTLGKNITSIDDYENLISVVMPKNLETIERFAFYHCDNLEEITIPAGVTGIGESAFGCCEKIKNIKLSQGITSIKEKTFWYCDGLERLIIPENVTQIQSNALLYCTGMKDLYYPAGLNISSLGITSSTLQASYVINDDGTVSITVTNIPEGTTDITLPEEISERQISSLSFAEGLDGTGISIQCTKHFPNTGEWEKDAEAGTYLTEPGKAVSDYTYFCKISCGEYSIESNEAVISIAKADSPGYSRCKNFSSKYNEEGIGSNVTGKLGMG